VVCYRGWIRMSYLGGVLGHIAEGEFLGHFGRMEDINLRVCEKIIW